MLNHYMVGTASLYITYETKEIHSNSRANWSKQLQA